MRKPIFAVVTLFVASACAGGGAGGAASGSGSVSVTMSEFAFKPAQVTVVAGKPVLLRLVNGGKIEHEFMIGRQRMPSGGFMENFLEGLDVTVDGKPLQAAGGGDHGAMFTVPPGTAIEVAFTAPAETGTWGVGCFLVGHYEAGMKGTLVVR